MLDFYRRWCFYWSFLWLGPLLVGSQYCWTAPPLLSAQQQHLYQKALDGIRQKIENSADGSIVLKHPISVGQMTRQGAHATRRQLKKTLKQAQTQPSHGPSVMHALSRLYETPAGRADQTAAHRYKQFFTEIRTLSSKAVEQARLFREGGRRERSYTIPEQLMSMNEQIYTPTPQSLSQESICSVFQDSQYRPISDARQIGSHANRIAFQTMLQSLSRMRQRLSHEDEQWHPLRWMKEKLFGRRMQKPALDLSPKVFAHNLQTQRETLAPEFELLTETTERHAVTYYSQPDSATNSWWSRLKQRFSSHRSDDVKTLERRSKLMSDLNDKPYWASVILDLNAPLFRTGGTRKVMAWEDFQSEVFKELGVSRQPSVDSRTSLDGFLKYNPEVNGLLRPEANAISSFLRSLEGVFVTKDDAGHRFVSQDNRKMIMSLVYEMIHQKVAKEASFSHEVYSDRSSAREEREALRVGLSLAKEACQSPGKITPQFEERLNQLPLILFGRAIEFGESVVPQAQIENIQKLLQHLITRCPATQIRTKPSHRTVWDYFSDHPASPVQGYDRETVKGCFRAVDHAAHCVQKPADPIIPTVLPAVKAVLEKASPDIQPQEDEKEDLFYDALETQEEGDGEFYDALETQEEGDGEFYDALETQEEGDGEFYDARETQTK